MATPAVTLHLSRLARHLPLSSPFFRPVLFPCARIVPKLPFRRRLSFSGNLSRRFTVAASISPGTAITIHSESFFPGSCFTCYILLVLERVQIGELATFHLQTVV
jgi:hypothetical protein